MDSIHRCSVEGCTNPVRWGRSENVARDLRIEWRERALAAEAERDALAAVIKKVHAELRRALPMSRREALVTIDMETPADLLREHDAEVWAAAIQEARRVVQRRHGQPYETDIDLITLPNPYREKREDE